MEVPEDFCFLSHFSLQTPVGAGIAYMGVDREANRVSQIGQGILYSTVEINFELRHFGQCFSCFTVFVSKDPSQPHVLIPAQKT